jgi:hypothetical protein
MKHLKNLICLLFILVQVLVSGQELYSQIPEKTIIKGTVTDANTGEPLSYVSVLLKGTTVGTITDSKGKYNIETTVPAVEIRFSFIGYEAESHIIRNGTTQVINIRLKLSSISLEEVTIKPKRKEYKNKNNPAVELIEKVIARKDLNRRESFSYLKYKKYEKILLALSNISEGFKESGLFNDFRFIFENMDTTRRIGNDVLPLYLKEALSEHYYRQEPEATKEIILADKAINLQRYLDNKGVTANLNYLYQDINIYDNEILFLTNKFLSPVAGTAPLFYRYFIIDTLAVKDIKCIQLFFEPRNQADFLFHGNLFITLDSAYAIRKIDIGINKNINIDWIQNISVTQDFERSGQGFWLLSKEEISIDVGVVKNSLGLYAQRTVSYQDYKINEPFDDKIFSGPEKSENIDPAAESAEFWENNRQVPLSKSERRLYTMADSVNQVPAFKRKMNIVMLLSTGFLDLGKIELGPAGSFYSFNEVEGRRVRFGGRTTPDFSKKINFDAYAAYGFGDKTFKYNAGITYSLTPRTIYQFPVKSLRLSYQKDTRIPGQELQFTQSDNIFLSFKRGIDDKLLLNNTVKFEYLNEFENHFSYLLGYSFTRQEPKGNLFFNYEDYLSETGNINQIDLSELYLNLRYAPNESFYQGKLYRDHFPNKYPVIQLKIAGGSKLFLNDYDYMRFQLNISRRYYISILGYTDVSLEAGKIVGKVPYPLLFIHSANQSYSYLKDSYNLMNFLEFVSDKYVSLNIDHSFNGFLFNKIPLLKKMKLREIVTFKALYGGLGEKNNPAYNDDLFKFPVGSDNMPLTFTLEKKPYIEASIGLSNIFRIFRVDLIKRFTYLDHPNVSGLGIRVQFRLDI